MSHHGLLRTDISRGPSIATLNWCNFSKNWNLVIQGKCSFLNCLHLTFCFWLFWSPSRLLAVWVGCRVLSTSSGGGIWTDECFNVQWAVLWLWVVVWSRHCLASGRQIKVTYPTASGWWRWKLFGNTGWSSPVWYISSSQVTVIHDS